ncbi:MAG TPA: right-handed parallel beta-helix repeat-containing protein [Thermoanaerobaculia bacterium]|nr:right-handed parallel beta-helix repeat-containing protein [Thermoanaerobaculia bacterium]
MRNAILGIFMLLLSVEAHAQIARVFLSGTGNDANDCTVQTTPCRSLQGALNQSPAGGEIIVLSSGGFGTATITKSITIDAPHGVVAFNGRTINVQIAASDTVVIRGLSMNGLIFADPTGINFTTAGTLIIEGATIFGFGRGVSVTGAGARLMMHDCEVRNNGTHGVDISPGAGADAVALIENCRFEANGYDAFGAGIRIADNAVAVVHETTAMNHVDGVLVDGNAGHGPLVVLEHAMLGFNDAAIRSHLNGASAATTQVSDCTLLRASSTIVETTGGAEVKSWSNNQVEGENPFTGTLQQQ